MNDAPLSPVTLPRELALELLADMVRIRRFEERCADLYGQQKIRGFLHLYIGKEAVAVGAVHALAADHRASDDHRGALFLNETRRLLQDPAAFDTETA